MLIIFCARTICLKEQIVVKVQLRNWTDKVIEVHPSQAAKWSEE